ncbi:hypothetical protein ABUE31_05345 [Mesorhizobium sp. ZMM04-5]|uniref:Uncharacterized protein n=1 Tax=Mesorhizobium marinum TaxID=3228790 RepID=A0ABV3QWI2_9HYPH
MSYQSAQGRRSVASGRLALAAAAGLLLAAGDAQAISRYMSTTLTCSKVKAILGREGAAILQHRSPRTGVVLYDRYVKSRAFCPSNQTTDRTYVPTSDLKSCPVYRCKEIEFFDLR